MAKRSGFIEPTGLRVGAKHSLLPPFLSTIFPSLHELQFSADLPHAGTSVKLFGTVLAIEQRAQIVAVVVAGCLVFLSLHLAFYPYPSIIPWFVNLEHVHNYCVQHAGQLICQANKK